MAGTNIDLDEALRREARKLSRLKTKRKVVNTALAFFVRYERLKASCAITAPEFGKVT